MPNKTNYKKYEEELLKEKGLLMKEVGSDKSSVDFGDDVDSMEEESDEAEEKTNVLGVQEAVKNRINEIDAALNKIAKDEYGICEKCGGEISDNVLDAAPESLLCESCKK